MPRPCRSSTSRAATSSGRPGFGLGAVALASLLDERLLAGAETLPEAAAATARRTSRRRRSRSSTCSWPARRRSSTCSTTSRSCGSTTASRSRRSSSRASGSPSSRARRGCSARRSTFAKHGQSGAEISSLLPHLAEHRRRDRDRPVDAHDAVQPRAGADLHEHGPPDHRAAQPRVVAHLRPRQRERATCPAFVVLHLRAEQPGRRQVAAGAAASCRPPTRASSSARRASRCSSRTTPTASTARCGASRSISSRDLNRAQHADDRRPRDRRRASPPTRWPTGCRRACRS